MELPLDTIANTHSRLAELYLSYLARLEHAVTHNPLLAKFGLRLDHEDESRRLRVPLRVQPYAPAYEETQMARKLGVLSRSAATQQAHHTADSNQPVKKFRLQHPPRLWAKVQDELQMGVLLGASGSGKSELLRHLTQDAIHQARQHIVNFQGPLEETKLPIFLPLKEVRQYLSELYFTPKGQGQPGWKANQKILQQIFQQYDSRYPSLSASDINNLFADDATETKRLPLALIFALYRKGWAKKPLLPWLWQRLRPEVERASVLLCLDAWDEVQGDGADQMPRAACRAALWHYADTRQPPRIFVTTRPSSYDHALLPTLAVEAKDIANGPRRELSLLPFREQECVEFVGSFFRAAEQEEIGQRLQDDMQTKQFMADLATTPLMATMLCIAFLPHRKNPTLPFPARRAEVYQRVLERLLYEWDTDYEDLPDRAKLLRDTLISEKKRLLEELAFKFHEELQATGKLKKESLESFLREYQSELPKGSQLKKIPALAAELCRDGILKVTSDAVLPDYDWLHFAFADYLLARAVARRLESKKLKPHKREALWEQVSHLAQDETQSEVIVLLAGILADPSQLFSLLAGGPEQANVKSRWLAKLPFFGLLGSRDKQDKRTQPADGLTPVLAAQCLAETNASWRSKNAAQVNAITSTVFTSWSKRIEIDKTPDVPLRAALRALAQVNGEVYQVANQNSGFLLDLLMEEFENKGVASWAGVAFVWLGHVANRPVVTKRLNRLQAHPDSFLSWSAEWAKCVIGMTAPSQGFVTEISRRLDVNDSISLWAMLEALKVIGSEAVKQVNLRVDLYERQRHGFPMLDEDNFLLTANYLNHQRQIALRKRSELNTGVPVQIILRLSRLMTHEVWWVRATAAGVVGLGFGIIHQDLLTQLTRLLIDTESSVRLAAVQAVGKLSSSELTPEMLTGIARLLTDESMSVRNAAARTVERWESLSLHWGTLRLIGHLRQEILAQLTALLDEADSWWCHFIMKELSQSGKEVTLTKLAHLTAELAGGREYPPEANCRMGPGRARLSQLVQNLTHEDWWTRVEATEELGQLLRHGKTPELLDLVAIPLADENSNVRLTAVRELGQLRYALLDQLLPLLADRNSAVCVAAIEEISQFLRYETQEPKSLLQMAILLADEDDYWGVREAVMLRVSTLDKESITPQIRAQLESLLTDANDRVGLTAYMTLLAVGD